MAEKPPSSSSSGVLKEILLSYTYVSIWITLSFSVIIYNKYILDPQLYNWSFPISLTLIHMAFCSTLAFIFVRVLKIFSSVSIPKSTYLRSVIPVGALYALSLWLSNSAYIFLSVSFIQMLKALMPVAVYSISLLFKRDRFKPTTMLNMLSVSLGVAVAAYGEARFNLWGVALQLGAVVFEATRLVMIEMLLNSRGIKLNPIQTLYYVAPCCFIFLLVPWIFVELPLLRVLSNTFSVSGFDVLIFGTNSSCAFALNLAVFLLVGKTSALTMNVAGVVKDWLLITFSWSVIKDTVTPLNLAGYGLAFVGVAYYNRCKFLALREQEAQRKAIKSDEEAAALMRQRQGNKHSQA
ncbi:probable sugar phosphate/phosphate translocator At5g25400 [Carica papaya]|uniref:probable sugar phosphate/phosphate translocator At5g25400 n=1 Tax=Carica papaya TaxID=3649 RepID=UPI000B8CBDD7|nr:probable sugar phosphate/phosphate translocator At5g25400 [Carica papaya]